MSSYRKGGILTALELQIATSFNTMFFPPDSHKSDKIVLANVLLLWCIKCPYLAYISS